MFHDEIEKNVSHKKSAKKQIYLWNSLYLYHNCDTMDIWILLLNVLFLRRRWDKFQRWGEIRRRHRWDVSSEKFRTADSECCCWANFPGRRLDLDVLGNLNDMSITHSYLSDIITHKHTRTHMRKRPSQMLTYGYLLTSLSCYWVISLSWETIVNTLIRYQMYLSIKNCLLQLSTVIFCKTRFYKTWKLWSTQNFKNSNFPKLFSRSRIHLQWRLSLSLRFKIQFLV